MTVTPFQIHVSDDVLADLRARLTRTRFTSPSDSDGWAAGTDPGYLRDLVAYWARGFDWRAAEAALNAVPQFTAEVDGQRVHFVHLRGRRAEGAPAPLPLVLTHGWPGSFVEMLRVAPLLTDPGGPGRRVRRGDPVAAGIPVLRPAAGTVHAPGRGPHLAPADDREPGLPRFGAFGGDIGGGVTQWLGALYPGPVVGVHLTSALMADEFASQPPTPDEQAYLDALHAYDLHRPGLQRDHVDPAGHHRRRAGRLPGRARGVDRRQVPGLE